MTKEVITKEQIKNELDQDRRGLMPMLVGYAVVCVAATVMFIAFGASYLGERNERGELLYFPVIFFFGAAAIGVFGSGIVIKAICKTLFGSWHNRDIIITRDEVSRMVDDETISRYDYYNRPDYYNQLKEKHFGFYRDSSIRHQENILYFYRCGRYVANSTVFGYTSVGDEFYLISYADDPERPILIYSTKIYEIKE